MQEPLSRWPRQLPPLHGAGRPRAPTPLLLPPARPQKAIRTLSGRAAMRRRATMLPLNLHTSPFIPRRRQNLRPTVPPRSSPAEGKPSLRLRDSVFIPRRRRNLRASAIPPQTTSAHSPALVLLPPYSYRLILYFLKIFLCKTHFYRQAPPTMPPAAAPKWKAEVKVSRK